MQLLMAILAVVIGLAFAFGGWRFFLLLLPLGRSWSDSASRTEACAPSPGTGRSRP